MRNDQVSCWTREGERRWKGTVTIEGKGISRWAVKAEECEQRKRYGLERRMRVIEVIQTWRAQSDLLTGSGERKVQQHFYGVERTNLAYKTTQHNQMPMPPLN